MFSVKVNNLAKSLKRFDNTFSKSNEAVKEALLLAGYRVNSYAKRSIQNSPPDPDTGRSKPGNPPKTDKGLLARSVFTYVSEMKTVNQVFTGTRVLYGKFLEFGTQAIEARPWLQPAFEETKKENLDGIRKAVKTAVASESIK